MIKRLLFPLLVCTSTLSAIAQSEADIQTPRITPPSADAASLGKFGQIPVDKSSGLPAISVPLYEIKTPRFQLPISLSYHASGIKVEEIASWVGLGWALNAGGVITRTINGFTDDGGYGLLTNHSQIKKAADIQWPADITFISNVVTRVLDVEPDNFFYNFNGHSGAFVFGDDTNPVTVPFEPIKINFNQSNKNFTVTDDRGNSYSFTNKEMVNSFVSNELSGISSWYLSQMVSADHSDTIQFVYTTDPNPQTEYSYNFSQDLTNVCNENTTSLRAIVKTQNIRQFTPVRLSSIQFKGGKVDFVTKGNRLDEAAFSLDEIIVYSLNAATGQYTRLKSFKLQTDYFYSTLQYPSDWFITIDEKDKHRLKLTGVQELDAGSNVVDNYSFDYNPGMLPQVHSFAQDNWGYFNGKIMNKTLLQSQNVIFTAFSGASPQVAVIGGDEGADRSVSEPDMRAGVLQKITYPTKGYTVFNYECNKVQQTVYTPGGLTIAAIGAQNSSGSLELNQQYYTPTNDMLGSGGNIFNIKLSTGNNPVSDPIPYVKVVRVSDGLLIYNSSSQGGNGQINNVVLTLQTNVQYQITAEAHGHSSPPSSSSPYAIISTSWTIPSLGIANVGGLRVSSIANYNSDGTPAGTETYKYGITDESGGGTSISILQSNHHSRGVVCTTQPADGGSDITFANDDTYSNNSFYPLSTLNSSPVGYPMVTTYKGDATTNIGKTVTKYTITQDSLLIQPNFWSGIRPIQVGWKNGGPTWEGVYKNIGSNQYSLVSEMAFDYNIIGRKPGIGTIIGYVRDPIGTFNTCSYFVSPFVDHSNSPGHVFSAGGGDCEWLQTYLYWFDYPIPTGNRVLKKKTDTHYAPDGTTLHDVTEYYYDNLDHMLPTRIVTYNSAGVALARKINYPQDMVKAVTDPTGIFAAMVSANILAPAVEEFQYKNTTQIFHTKTNYNTFNGTLIEPASIETQTQAGPSEVRMQYLSYDSRGNIQAISKDNNSKISYKWGYKQQYPVAEVVNADNTEFYIEGFEENAAGTAGAAHTGSYYYSGTSYTVTWTRPNSRNYVISYWYLSGGVWKFMPEQAFTGTFTMSNGTGYDDIRVQPKDAQMKTYTYSPLLGMTSSIDPNGITNYYEYDNFSRLKLIRDQDGNILKTLDYHYHVN